MTKKNKIAIVQARMGSTRLPGKVLKPILSKPMLWHIVNRLKQSKLIDEVVIATSVKKEDDKIIRFCNKNKIKCFRGSENDVLNRFYETAKHYQAEIVIRITADCPLVDPEIIDHTISTFINERLDYIAIATGAGASNKKVYRFPDGLDCEVFTFDALEKAHQNAKNELEREHATMYIWKRPKLFKQQQIESKIDYSYLRFTVDFDTDLNFVRKVYSNLYNQNPHFGLNDVINLIKTKKEILEINAQNIGKEGYEVLFYENH